MNRPPESVKTEMREIGSSLPDPQEFAGRRVHRSTVAARSGTAVTIARPRFGKTSTGVLLAGHGTRDELGRSEFQQLAEKVKRRLAPFPVEAGYLELADPNLADAFAELVDRGLKRVVTVPLMLFAAAHVRADIPGAVLQAARKHRGVAVEMTSHLGCRPELVRLALTRCRQGLSEFSGGGGDVETDGRRGPANPDRSRDLDAILVGRGTHDGRALAEMRRFSSLWNRQGPCPERSRLAYLAMASPRLEDVLKQVEQGDAARVIVQPHLLFHGYLADKVSRLVGEIVQAGSSKEWSVAPYIGPCEGLAEVVADIAGRHLDTNCLIEETRSPFQPSSNRVEVGDVA